MPGPYYVTCQNPACGKRFPVRTPYEQRRRKTCSRSCQGTVFSPVRSFTPAQRHEHLQPSRNARRQQAMQRFTGMSPIEAFRQGYAMGWKSGMRAMQRRLLA